MYPTQLCTPQKAAAPCSYPTHIKTAIRTEFRTVSTPIPATARVAVERMSFLMSRCMRASSPRKVVTEIMLEQPGATTPITTSPDFVTSWNWVPAQATGTPRRATSLDETTDDAAARGSPKAHWSTAG